MDLAVALAESQVQHGDQEEVHGRRSDEPPEDHDRHRMFDLMAGQIPAEGQGDQFTDRALRQARHMTQLVEALLQLTRAGGSRRSEVIAVPDLLYGVTNRFEALALQTGVKLQITSADDAFVTIDPDLVEVALGNLVVNAIAHSPPGGIVLVEGLIRSSTVILRVADQGPGVPPQERERIFHPFVRGNSPQADRSGARVGLGLGLAIAHRVVEGHGSQIHVDHAPHGGAVFSFQLPLTPRRRRAAALIELRRSMKQDRLVYRR